jgi:lysylphosphatidylglycerol synthetase-like protein (DUF2156 family)
MTCPGPGWRATGLAVFTLAALLLGSMGGGMVAAPVTVSLMVVAARRHPTPAFRAAATVLVALTMGEVAWAVTYLAVQEDKPWIWLLPLLVALGAGAAVSLATVNGDHFDQQGSPSA